MSYFVDETDDEYGNPADCDHYEGPCSDDCECGCDACLERNSDCEDDDE